MGFPGVGSYNAMPAWQPPSWQSASSNASFAMPDFSAMSSWTPIGQTPETSSDSQQLMNLYNQTSALCSQISSMLNYWMQQAATNRARSPLGLNTTNTSYTPQNVANTQSTGTQQPLPGTEGKPSYQAKATSYYPANDPIEGGFKDMRGKPLYTLQDYLEGKAPYVSVAMDNKNSFAYGTKLRIPELEKKYGKKIEFRVVDTGGDFYGKGTSRIDICTRNEKTSLDSSVNGNLTLIPVS
jgi:hypothetical protein